VLGRGKLNTLQAECRNAKSNDNSGEPEALVVEWEKKKKRRTRMQNGSKMNRRAICTQVTAAQFPFSWKNSYIFFLT